MLRTRRINNRLAFSLMELMVVIAIIGILLGILLPSMNHVRQQARNIQCQTNLKSIIQGLLGYAQENRGSFPYGFHWARTKGPMGSRLVDWEEASGNNREFVSWASQVTKYGQPGKMTRVESDPENYNPMLQCPEAQMVRPHYVSYAMNLAVAVDPLLELSVSSPPRAQIRPPKMADLRDDTALVWDTAVFVTSDFDIDFILGIDIDGGRALKGAATPQFRYFSKNDPLSGPPLNLGQHKPIQLSGDKEVFRNIDPPVHGADPKASAAPYRGNLRFRHQKGSACNVGFFSGHVGMFNAAVTPDGVVQSHTALRRHFLINWPAGVPADPKYPY